MYKGYKIVAVTPAGRQCYLEILLPHIRNQQIIDEHHLWINTIDPERINYIEKIQKRNPKYYKLFYLDVPWRKETRCASITSFYKYAIEPDAVYIRFDDDVVWLSPSLALTLVDFRIANPYYWVIFPIIVNNSMNYGILHDWNERTDHWARNPHLAYSLHQKFFSRLRKGLEQYEFDRHEVLFNFAENSVADVAKLNCYININCVCWFGLDFKKFNGEIAFPEEHDFNVWKPIKYQRPNCICGKAWAVHFAFHVHQEQLESLYPSLLSEYKTMAPIKI